MKRPRNKRRIRQSLSDRIWHMTRWIYDRRTPIRDLRAALCREVQSRKASRSWFDVIYQDLVENPPPPDHVPPLFAPSHIKTKLGTSNTSPGEMVTVVEAPSSTIQSHKHVSGWTPSLADLQRAAIVDWAAEQP